MAETCERIEAMLKEFGWEYEDRGKDPERFRTGLWFLNFRTTTYRHGFRRDEPFLRIHLWLKREGRLLLLECPEMFRYVPSMEKWADYRWACRVVERQCEEMIFRLEDGQGWLHAFLSVPLEDATLTPRQLRRMVERMVAIAEDLYPVIDQVTDPGPVDQQFVEDRLEFLILPPELRETYARRMNAVRRSNDLPPAYPDYADLPLPDLEE